jgi:YihY family inner membrane protein
MAEPASTSNPSLIDRLFDRVLNLRPVQRPRAVFSVFNQAGGSLLAEGLAYSALFAGLTGLLLAVGLFGYLVPSAGDRQRLIDGFSGHLTPWAPIAQNGLDSIAAHAGVFSIVGLAGLVWGSSHFYGALDEAIARVFAKTPARAAFDRLLRGFVSVLLLVGGLLSGIGLSALQAVASKGFGTGLGADVDRLISAIGFTILTAVVVVIAVGFLYRVVPNTNVPLRVLALPALIAGLILTGLAELLVFIEPLLTGALSVFGGVAAVFAALAWLHLAFQVLLIGASWTRLRLEDAAK